jgi:hypothetical protein
MFAKSLVAVVTLACSALIGAAASSSPMVADSRTFVVPLSGHAHPPSRRLSGLAGDSDGSGLVKIQVDLHQKQICYDFSLSGVATPLMAHIHKAPALQDGPTVVTLFTGPGGELRDCHQPIGFLRQPVHHGISGWSGPRPAGRRIAQQVVASCFTAESEARLC